MKRSSKSNLLSKAREIAVYSLNQSNCFCSITTSDFKIIKKTVNTKERKGSCTNYLAPPFPPLYLLLPPPTIECSLINSQKTTLLDYGHMISCTLIGTESSALATPPTSSMNADLKPEFLRSSRSFYSPMTYHM